MMVATISPLLSAWKPLRPVTPQREFIRSRARFRVLACGRRSGKSELGGRWLVRGAMNERDVDSALFGACAPTREQARDLFWLDSSRTSLFRLIPPWAIRTVDKSHLAIELKSGHRIWVFGTDEPARAEGRAFRRILADEVQAMKPDAWSSSLRPTLSTDDCLGSAVICGRPRGRNHFWDLFEYARNYRIEYGPHQEWDAFTWKSEVVVDAAEIASARRELDQLTFEQEYEASFLNFAGRAYYEFVRETHAREPLTYNPKLPLDICLDFNVEPGVAAVMQTQQHATLGLVDAVIGEVWIPLSSSTPAVCRRLVADWGKHTGAVRMYGDASGGARGSAKTSGSDWDIVRAEFRPVFGDRVSFHIQSKNPDPRARVNALNARLRSADGKVHMLVCPIKAPQCVKDLEGTVVLKGGSGEIDKKSDPERSHLTDAIGYRAHAKYPLGGATLTSHAVGVSKVSYIR